MIRKIVLVIAAVALAGFVYNEVSASRDRAAHPPAGKLISVDGYATHLYCAGSGSPAIVFESGQGDDLTMWRDVQGQLAKVTCTCSYDRAGLGWSAPRPGPRDSKAIAEQLHGLLDVAGIRGPIVLVGQSAGGLHARAYVARYPREVAALVMLDASTPEQVTRMPPRVRKAWADFARQLVWQRWSAMFGLARLRGDCSDDECRPSVIAAERAEALDFDRSAAEASHTGPFGDLPLLVVSQDPARRVAGTPEREQAEIAAIWNSLQGGLTRLSTRNRRIIARGAPHHIERVRPEVIVREVTRLVGFVRGEASEEWGSTRVE